MNREQAKIRCKLSKEEWEALGEHGLAKWYEVMEHFGDGWDVEYLSGRYWKSTSKPSFDCCGQYRIKPRTHIVNGFEVPEPIKEYTGQETIYVPKFCNKDWTAPVYSTYLKTVAIKRGAVFGTREAARANAMAMLGIDPSTYKEQAE